MVLVIKFLASLPLKLQVFAVSPKNTIIIGDAPMDYMMGVQSGINTILISTGQIEKKDLLNITPFVCNNVSELRLQF